MVAQVSRRIGKQKYREGLLSMFVRLPTLLENLEEVCLLAETTQATPPPTVGDSLTISSMHRISSRSPSNPTISTLTFMGRRIPSITPLSSKTPTTTPPPLRMFYLISPLVPFLVPRLHVCLTPPRSSQEHDFELNERVPCNRPTVGPVHVGPCPEK